MTAKETRRAIEGCEHRVDASQARAQFAALLAVTRHRNQRTVILHRGNAIAVLIPVIDLAILDEDADPMITTHNVVELKKYRSNTSVAAVVDLTRRYETVNSDLARKNLPFLFKEAKYSLKRTIVALHGKVAAVIVPISDLAELNERERKLTESQKKLLASIKGASPKQLLSASPDAEGEDNDHPSPKRKRVRAVRLSRNYPRTPKAG